MNSLLAAAMTAVHTSSRCSVNRYSGCIAVTNASVFFRYKSTTTTTASNTADTTTNVTGNNSTGNCTSAKGNDKPIRQLYDYDCKQINEYTYDAEHMKYNKVNQTKSITASIKESASLAMLQFLPKGYPQSVAPCYIQFVRGQMISVVVSSAGGVLAMQSLLYAIGLGSGAIPLAATLNWILKDGLGQLGGVIFASMVNNKFDADPKRWRMASSVSMDVSCFIELLTPFAPGYFLLLASIANVGMSVSIL